MTWPYDTRKPILRRRFIGVPSVHGHLGGSDSIGVNYARLSQVEIPWRMEIDRIAIQNGNAVLGNVRVGIYKEGSIIDDPEGGSLLWQSGSYIQSVVESFQWVDIVPPIILEAGRYYCVVVVDNATATSRNYNNDATVVADRLGWGWVHAFGAFPSPCPAVTDQASASIFLLRVSRNLA